MKRGKKQGLFNCRHGYRRGDVAPLTWVAVIEPKIDGKMSEWLRCQAAVAAVWIIWRITLDNAECCEETQECSIVMQLQHPGLSRSAQCNCRLYSRPAAQLSSPAQCYWTCITHLLAVVLLCRNIRDCSTAAAAKHCSTPSSQPAESYLIVASEKYINFTRTKIP